MILTAREISVDAGIIIICDPTEIAGRITQKELKKRYKGLYKTFKVENGKYRINWYIQETWNGPVDGWDDIEITSGKLIVIDPCYLIKGSKWSEWLEEIDYFQDKIENVCILKSMGGDGDYDVGIQLI